MKLKLAHSAAENARVVLPKMARKYFEAGRKAIQGKRPPDELHGFRLETKRFRYTLELFRPLYGPTMDRYLKALRELQGALGKVSDYQAIQRVLSDDDELNKHLDHAVKGKVKDLRHTWRAFDAAGELKRWRTYLGGDHSKPRMKRPTRAASKEGGDHSKPRMKRPTKAASKKVAIQAAS
jgi:CHAD domain-containing protein